MDEILEKLIDYSLSISINDYQFNETLIKIVYLNIDVKETTKEKLNVALSEIIAEIYLIKIKEFELKDEIEKINKANIIIKKLKNKIHIIGPVITATTHAPKLFIFSKCPLSINQ